MASTGFIQINLVLSLFKALTTLLYGLRSIRFNGAKIWNSIPPEIRDASSVRNFKNNLKNLYFDSYIT